LHRSYLARMRALGRIARRPRAQLDRREFPPLAEVFGTRLSTATPFTDLIDRKGRAVPRTGTPSEQMTTQICLFGMPVLMVAAATATEQLGGCLHASVALRVSLGG
jgi:hypothetical protein